MPTRHVARSEATECFLFWHRPESSLPPRSIPEPLHGMGERSSPVMMVATGPRERVLQLGEPRLSDAECLALVLRTGVKGEPAEQMAQRLLRQFGGLAGLAVRSVRELGAQVVRHTARGSRRENFFVVLLDVRSRVMALHQVSTGVVDSAPVHPREVFGPAVREAAVAVVIAHNHPSGDPSPSRQDHEVTDRLKSAGALLGIDVLDHVVVGTDRYYSFADEAFFAYG